jgi:hypothetical protein
MRVVVITLSFIMLLSGVAFARDTTYGRGHTKRDGMYVEPHQRTNPNDVRNDHRAAKGDVNTNRQSRKNPDPYDKRYDNQFNRPPY